MCWLVMVGEGAMRSQMEELIKDEQIERVILTGFVNQSVISQYYSICDVFVMCSSLGENWGLSVNEAMNFDTSVILSDLTGCSDDLVKEGVNGYIFETGNIPALSDTLNRILIKNELTKTLTSREIVQKFSFSSSLDVFYKLA
jgi:glycosyltransferase involved in cell wall biosynthesis